MLSASPAPANVLRARPGVLGQWLTDRGMALLPFVFGMLRRFRPILKFGNNYLITRHDTVREVFATDTAFGAPYRAKLDIIMGGEPFILGQGDTPDYHAGLRALHKVVRRDDVPMLARKVTAMADAIVASAGGRIEVVDSLVRRVTFDFLAQYLGVPEPPGGNLQLWTTRLFEFQFVSSDAPLRAEVNVIAPALRAHVQNEIERRRAAPEAKDDVLERCLKSQAAGEQGYSDAQIRTALIGLIVGGPPQPPMVLPQALEQLFRRPQALADAQAAARADDDDLLAAHIMEAMRFDPLAPWMPRVALTARTIAAGTKYEREIPAGAKMLVSIASAMRDERRVPEPLTFDATRSPDQYLHFGHGMHECFGREINRATLHLILKPLLKCDRLRRATGSAGHLRKRGPFASTLFAEFS